MKSYKPTAPPDPNLAKLAALQSKLLTEFVREVDPANWPSMESAKDRGDRLWWKRNANGTADLLLKVSSLRLIRAAEFADEGSEARLAAEGAAAEAEARRLSRDFEKSEAKRLAEKVVDIASGKRG